MSVIELAVRDTILAATILILIFMVTHPDPKPIVSQVDYCPMYRSIKDPFGKWQYVQIGAYRLCSEMDRYEDA